MEDQLRKILLSLYKKEQRPEALRLHGSETPTAKESLTLLLETNRDLSLEEGNRIAAGQFQEMLEAVPGLPD